MINMNETRCSSCYYRKSGKRSQAQAQTEWGAVRHYCEHPCITQGVPFRTKFISMGTPTLESPIKLKTRPKWCPRLIGGPDIDEQEAVR